MLLGPERTAISLIRERRRERILQNSDQRIRRILSGPDGTEVRNAPALEGGEGFKDLVYPCGTPIRIDYANDSFLFIDREYYLALDYSLHDVCNDISGAIVQNLWYFIKESLVIALFFILFNALFCIFALIVGKCCSL
uniref:Uncharacterized protein n=1 Tax=Elaeophora elaphi TaxID=1147741 RepID=A0A0R3S6K6_9BILA